MSSIRRRCSKEANCSKFVSKVRFRRWEPWWSGRLLSLNDDNLRTIIELNWKIGMQKISCQISCWWRNYQIISSSIRQMWKISKWVPHSFTHEKKLQRLTICSSYLSRFKSEPLLDWILTYEGKLVTYWNNKRFHHWLFPSDPLPQTPKVIMITRKTFLCVWWTSTGIIHREYLDVGQNITAAIYCDQLDRVR